MAPVEDAHDMEATHKRIRDASEQLGHTEILLEENQVKYGQYLENRKLKRACGGKKMGTDLRAEKKVLQNKIQGIQQEIGELEGLLQAMQEEPKILQRQLPPSPGEPMTEERVGCATGESTDAVDQENDNHADMRNNGLMPDARQVTKSAQPGVLPETTPNVTSVDPGGQLTGASPLSSLRQESSGPPTLTASPPDLGGLDTVPVSNLPTTGSPNPAPNAVPSEDTSKTVHEGVTGRQTVVTITKSLALSPSTNSPNTLSSVIVNSDISPSPAGPPLNRVSEDEAGVLASNGTFHSVQLEKDKAETHLPRKRPAEDLEHMAGQNVKRGRGFPGAHVAKKDPMQSKGGGHSVLLRRPKKENDLQRGNQRRSLAEIYKRQQKAKRKLKLLEDKPEETNGEEEDRDEEAEEDGDEEDKGDEEEGDGVERESSITDEPMIVDVEKSSKSRNLVSTSEDDEWSMRVHKETDVEDLQRSLKLHSTPNAEESAGRPGGKQLKQVTVKCRAVGRRGVAKQRAATAKRKAGKGREEKGMNEEGGMTKEEEDERGEGQGSHGDCVDKGKGQSEVTEGGTRGTDDFKIPGKADKYEPPRQRWDNMTDGERREDQIDARVAIRYFLANPDAKDREIPSHLRVLIREVSEFCPEAAYVTKELALHCLTSCFNNTVCIYHWYHDKAGKYNDANPPHTHQITGVPWERDMNAKDRPKDHPLIVLPTGALHCGCSENDALWDFLWWKTGGIYSPTLNIAEAWRTTRLEPRARGLMVEFIRKFTHMTLDDIYSDTMDYPKTRAHWLKILEVKAHLYRKDLKQNIMREAVGLKEKKRKKPAVTYVDIDSD